LGFPAERASQPTLIFGAAIVGWLRADKFRPSSQER
jgi:hypothetical protein